MNLKYLNQPYFTRPGPFKKKIHVEISQFHLQSKFYTS